MGGINIMDTNTKEKETSIVEPELSKKLRAFILSMDDTYGDGTTIGLARTHSDGLYDALNRYSHDAFVQYSEEDILAELIMDELLCDPSENDYVDVTRRLASLKTSAERIFKEVRQDKHYKEALIHSFIKRAGIPFSKKTANISRAVVDMIQKVSSYQLAKQESSRGKVSKGGKKKKLPFKKLRQ